MMRRSFATCLVAIALVPLLGQQWFGSAFANTLWGEKRVRLAHRNAADGSQEVSVDRIMMKILTPEGDTVQTVVSEASLPGLEGRLGVLRGHAHMLVPLNYGLLRYKRQGKWVPVVVHGGYATVQNNVVVVLTSNCEYGDAIVSADEAKDQVDTSTQTLLTSTSRRERLAAAQAAKLASARLQAVMLLEKEK